MSKPSKKPEGAPGHICDALTAVVNSEASSDARFTERLRQQVESGSITQQEAETKLANLPPGSSPDMLEYCRNNCGASLCAMRGYGVELVGVDPEELNAADRAKLDFFVNVDVTRRIAEISLGIAL